MRKSTSAQISMSAEARIAMEQLERDIRRSCHIDILDNEKTLDLTIASDEDNDGIWEYSHIYYKYLNGDGSDATIRDNKLIYDEDKELNGNEKDVLCWINVLSYLSPCPPKIRNWSSQTVSGQITPTTA